MVPLLALSMLSSTVDDISNMNPIKVMTYNIRYGTASDGENAWPLRKSKLLDLVKTTDPDLLGLQEALDFQIVEIRAVLPDHEVVGVGRDDGIRKGEHSVILFRRSKFGMREGGTRWISPTPLVPGSLGGTARITRVFSWGEFFMQGGKRILVMNAHLDHQSESGQVLGTQQMRQFAESRPGLPTLIMGDFNSGPDDAPMKELIQNQAFTPLLPAVEKRGTFTNFVASNDSGKMIDHIVVSPHWKSLSILIDRTSHDGQTPSDHCPVVATVQLNP